MASGSGFSIVDSLIDTVRGVTPGSWWETSPDGSIGEGGEPLFADHSKMVIVLPRCSSEEEHVLFSDESKIGQCVKKVEHVADVEVLRVRTKSELQSELREKDIRVLTLVCHGREDQILLSDEGAEAIITTGDVTDGFFDFLSPSCMTISLVACNTSVEIAQKIADVTRASVFASKHEIYADEVFINPLVSFKSCSVPLLATSMHVHKPEAASRSWMIIDLLELEEEDAIRHVDTICKHSALEKVIDFILDIKFGDTCATIRELSRVGEALIVLDNEEYMKSYLDKIHSLRCFPSIILLTLLELEEFAAKKEMPKFKESITALKDTIVRERDGGTWDVEMAM